MPNWCEGNIRFRGKMKNIERFLKNEIVSCRMINHEVIEEKPIIEDDGGCLIIAKPHEHSWFYIRNTNRNFFETDVLEIWIDKHGEEDPEAEVIVCIDDYRVAWSFNRDEAWKDFVKQYDFDVKMTGFESGGLFLQVKTILRSGEVENNITSYTTTENWEWNCTMPNYGG